MMKTFTEIKSRVISLLLAVTILFVTVCSNSIVSADTPDIVVKLNGEVVDYTNDIAVKNGNTLEVQVNFKNQNAGDEFIITLPDFFVRLDQNTINFGNPEILPYADLELIYNESTKEQQVKIKFKESVLAASFSFVGEMNVTSVTDGTEGVITIPGIGEITLIKESTPSSEGITIGTLPAPVPENNSDFIKESSTSTITNKELMEDKTIGDSFYYLLRLNHAQKKDVELTGTLKDTLPTGMQLFIPNAPSCGYTDYEDAFRSFRIRTYQTLIKTDASGAYLDVSPTQGANYIKYINQIEAAQGRSAGYTTDALNWRVNIPASLATALDSDGDGKLVSYSSLYVGYRIENSKIILSTIGSNTGDYDEKRTESWDDSSNLKYVPVYTTSDGAVGNVSYQALYTAIDFQVIGGTLLTGVSREYLGQSSSDETTSYAWDYLYDGEKEFTLTVTKNNLTGQDSFEVSMNVTQDSYCYGKSFTIMPHIYFDRSKWTIPSEGKISFANMATYNNVSTTSTPTYTYNFGSTGTAVVNAAKTVDEEKITYIDPEENPPQTYAISFSKLGDLSIPAGNFSIYDILDGNLAYEENSIKIYKSSGSGWEDVTVSSMPTEAMTDTTSGLNLKVSYETISDTNRIAVTNFGELSFAGQIKIEFDAKLKDTKYGTLVTNYFGETVKTFVDHKLSINKVDKDGASITSDSAEFSIQYTTDPDYENGLLKELKGPDGQAITSLSTGTTGTASILYRIEASNAGELDEFYLKLEETEAPDTYNGLSDPIWIKATRNSTTREMNYTLAKSSDAVKIGVNNNTHLVTLTVENEKPTPADVTLTGTKKLTGKDLTDGMFNFAVTDQADNKIVATGSNAGETITFEPITYTEKGSHTYEVSEINGGAGGITYDTKKYTVTVEVTEEDGELLATASYPDGNIVFNNSYTARSTTVDLTGIKELTGKDPADNMFGFTVTDQANNEIVATGTNAAGGTITFGTITYTEKGTYTYKVSETNGGAGGISYDTNEYTVIVEVEDNGTGNLVVKNVSYPDGAIAFNNIYTADSTTVELTSTKELTGIKDLTDNLFSFKVTDQTNGNMVATGTNKADGTITFSEIGFETTGTYTYTVSEINSGAGGISYDTNEYTVTVEVEDDGIGNLVTRVIYPDDGIVFQNQYNTDPIELPLNASKTLTGMTLEDGMFTFVVKDSSDAIVTEATNAAGGPIVFDALTFTAPGTYTYTISEVNNGDSWFNYDNGIYTVTVEVTDNEDGTLSTTATTTKDGEAADEILFANTYQPENTSVWFDAEKLLLGRDLEAGEFQFELKENGTVLATASNDGDGLVTFPEITYDKAGNYVYTVSETQGSLKKVIYDASIFTVTVEVEDVDHVLEAKATYTKEGEDQDTILFTNKYKPTVMDEEYYNNLEVLKFVDKAEAKPGETITYTITAENTGTVEKDDLVIKDYLPEYTTFVSSLEGTLMEDDAGEYVEWTIASLAPGEKVEFTFSVKVTEDAPNGHEIKNTAIYGNEKKTGTVTTIVKKVQGDSAVGSTPKNAGTAGTAKTLLKTTGTTKTGDTTQWLLWILCTAAAAGGIVVLIRRRSNR